MDAWQLQIERRVRALEEGYTTMREAMAENTELTRETHDDLATVRAGLEAVRTNTDDIVTFLRGSKLAGKIVIFFGGMAAAFSAMGAMVYGIWYFFKNGGPQQ